ncbi:MAG: single-stranded-DNA-specific exonuclease RecJ [Candidatus Berkiella sp.]
MSIKDLPRAKIKRRIVNESRENAAKAEGLDPLLARILAARPTLLEVSVRDMLAPKLKTLDPPQTLPDIDKAVARIATALARGEVIGIETDHDCDGQTSHAVLYCALVNIFGHPPEKIRSYIGHRLKEGYGLSRALAERILADEPQPSLVITADNGSSDEAQIALLKAHGIDVIVTDHHEIPIEGIPQSAYAVVSPTREDSQYPDRFIAGCMVAWLLMAAVRAHLSKTTAKEFASLAECLDFVAVGTIADCVSVARSQNNRAVVSYGMKLIAQGLRPCWRALLPILSTPLSSEDLGFKIGPLLNSDGRLACALGSVSFLLAKTDSEAREWVAHLQEQNAERKSIQDNITRRALEQALIQFNAQKNSLCIFLEDGHAGVHGISASRVKDWFGRPVIILCPKQDDANVLTGSARGVDGVHLRDALQAVHDSAPDIFIKFGGHQAAAGLTIHREKFNALAEAFEVVIQQQIDKSELGPVVWSDGELSIESVTVPFIKQMVDQLEPFGREFEPPAFELTGKIVSATVMGQTKTHLRLGLAVDELWFEAVWFNCCDPNESLPVTVGETVNLVYVPKVQTFRGQMKLSCQVIHLEKCGI